MSHKTSARRLTIVIDGELESKLREIQGQLISADRASFSLSRTVNMIILAGLMSADKLTAREWNIIKSTLGGKKLNLEEIKTREYLANLTALGQWV